MNDPETTRLLAERRALLLDLAPTAPDSAAEAEILGWIHEADLAIAARRGLIRVSGAEQ